MGGRKILITVTEEQYGMLNVLAKESGLERVSTFVKSEVIKGAQERLNPASERKNIIVPITNYEELSGYVEQKKVRFDCFICDVCDGKRHAEKSTDRGAKSAYQEKYRIIQNTPLRTTAKGYRGGFYLEYEDGNAGKNE